MSNHLQTVQKCLKYFSNVPNVSKNVEMFQNRSKQTVVKSAKSLKIETLSSHRKRKFQQRQWSKRNVTEIASNEIASILEHSQSVAINPVCNMQLNVLDDLAEAWRRWTEKKGLKRFGYRNFLNWRICCRLIHFWILRENQTLWLLGLCMTFDVVITFRDDVAPEPVAPWAEHWLFINGDQVIDFIAVIGLPSIIYERWPWISTLLRLEQLVLDCVFFHLAFLHVVVWWFQLCIPHWCLETCNAFHEAGTILAKWDAIGDQASGLKEFLWPEQLCIEHL